MWLSEHAKQAGFTLIPFHAHFLVAETHFLSQINRTWHHNKEKEY